MVDAIAPTPTDTICDPASGTCGFLVVANDYIREHYKEIDTDPALREHFHNDLFSGFDFDNTMLRIGSMNMQLHGVDNLKIEYRDSLAEDSEHDAEAYSVILANPPFAGSLDYEGAAKDLLATVRTKKTELLFLALFLRLMKTGGRAAVIVPDGVLFGSTKAHKTLRKMLVEDHKLDGIVSLPSGVFKPYADVSTAILFFTETGIGGTDGVWFYDLSAASASTTNATRSTPTTSRRARPLGGPQGLEHDRARTDQSFCVPASRSPTTTTTCRSTGTRKSLRRDRLRAVRDHRRLETLETEITQGLTDLKTMLMIMESIGELVERVGGSSASREPTFTYIDLSSVDRDGKAISEPSQLAPSDAPAAPTRSWPLATCWCPLSSKPECSRFGRSGLSRSDSFDRFLCLGLGRTSAGTTYSIGFEANALSR